VDINYIMEKKICKCGQDLIYKYEKNWGICSDCIEKLGDDEINDIFDEIHYRHKREDDNDNRWR